MTGQLDIFGQATTIEVPVESVQLAFTIVEAVAVAAARHPRAAPVTNFDGQGNLGVDAVRTATPRPMPRRRRR